MVDPALGRSMASGYVVGEEHGDGGVKGPRMSPRRG